MPRSQQVVRREFVDRTAASAFEPRVINVDSQLARDCRRYLVLNGKHIVQRRIETLCLNGLSSN
jgi:hypothetical protein